MRTSLTASRRRIAWLLRMLAKCMGFPARVRIPSSTLFFPQLGPERKADVWSRRAYNEHYRPWSKGHAFFSALTRSKDMKPVCDGVYKS